MSHWKEYTSRGWTRFPWDQGIATWAEHALPQALASADDPSHAQWMDCEGTWFIGVDALQNSPDGCLPGGVALCGAPIDFIRKSFGTLPDLHKAQVSIVYPGYPRPRTGEGEAAFRYRLRRDGAHVDGVKIYGEQRNRRVEEPHAWVLGLPLNSSAETAAPLVVWEGSHEIMRRGFTAAFAGVAPCDWHQVDVTKAYTAARAEVFETCPRIRVHAQPGEAYLMHRLCLHGVAPWEAEQDPEAVSGQMIGPATDQMTGQTVGRAIAYFRPEVAGGVASWLEQP